MTLTMKLLKTCVIATMLSAAPVTSFAKDKKMNGPEVVEIADISVGLNGLVCDFCSLALNKTFKKRDEVRGTYTCLLYTSPSPRDRTRSRMPSSA